MIKPYFETKNGQLYHGECLEKLKQLPDNSVDNCITSPPYYGLRDYNVEKQIGLEETPEKYVSNLVSIFNEVKRILKKDGTCWLNIGDTYMSGGSKSRHYGYPDPKHPNNGMGSFSEPQAGKHDTIKPKDLIGIPWRVAFALQTDDWYLRQDIIWHKPNTMPASVTDRCTTSHEYLFLLSKDKRYYFDYEAIQEIATGYDGRKDTYMKGSTKYKQTVTPKGTAHSFAKNGHERWKFKNLQDKGQTTHSFHENRVIGKDAIYPIRNKRSVWTVNTKPYKEAHFAVYPEQLITPCIQTMKPGAIVFDPFMGSGTTAIVAEALGRNWIGIELNKEYCEIAAKRIHSRTLAPKTEIKQKYKTQQKGLFNI